MNVRTRSLERRKSGCGVWGDTAVVTSLLWIKAVQADKPIDYKLWFSDTYVRTPAGWHYVFGQASLRLPKTDSK